MNPKDKADWNPEVRTKWSNENEMAFISVGEPDELAGVNYFLWEATPEDLAKLNINIGMPTVADARVWLDELKNRDDQNDSNVIAAIKACADYIQANKP